MIGWPIIDLFTPVYKSESILEKAKDIVVKMWGNFTTMEKRKAALKEMNQEGVSQTMFVVAHVSFVRVTFWGQLLITLITLHFYETVSGFKARNTLHFLIELFLTK